LGVYSNLESKWYSVLEVIDHVIPVTKVTDKIDEKVPSFLVFIAIIFILILLLIIPSISNTTQIFDVEVSVLNQIGLPLENVQIEFESECEGSSVLTNAEGKATFSVCGETIDLVASKTGYKRYSSTVDVEDKLSFKLFQQTQASKQMTILVDDGTNPILGAVIEVLCDGNLVNTLSNQSSRGFTFDTPECSILQVKSTAGGYVEQTITVLKDEERRTIHLEKINLTGEVTFYSNDPNGSVSGAEITIRSSRGGSKTIFTVLGAVTDEIQAGDYTYNAIYDGDLLSGSFTINPDDTEDVYLAFIDSTQISENNFKYLAVETISNAVGIPSVEVKFFKNDEQLSTRRTNSIGKTTPIKINPLTLEEGAVFSGVIKAIGYEAKFFEAGLVDKDEYQTVTLSEGGATLNLKLVNDIGVSEENAFVTLVYSGFSGIFDSAHSDSNGNVIFKNLPSGSYQITAVDEDDMDEANLSINLNQDEVKDLDVILRTGEGRIKFELLDYLGDDVDAAYELYANDGNGFQKLSEGITTRGYFQTNQLKVGTKVKLLIIDTNFIRHETLVYSIDRSTQTKEVYLRKESELPNNKEVQMFLMNVYDNNPLYGKAHKASKILAGGKYYLYFDVIVNNELNAGLVSNFTVLDEAQNDSHLISIEGAYSVTGSSRVMSETIGDFLIPSTTAVDADATQLNVSHLSVTGKVSIPIIVIVEIDQNAEGVKKITFESRHGLVSSLVYDKEFIVGESFCIYDCPIFMFSNYLIWEGKPAIPLTDSPERVLVGDDYYVQTKVHNLSDAGIGNAILAMTVPTEKLSYLTFENDVNRVTGQINLDPLSDSIFIEKKIVLKKASNSAKIYSAVEQMVNGIDILKHYEGNDNEIKLLIKIKEQLKISISETVLDQGVEYPQFIVKTKYNSKYTGVQAYWKAEKVTAGGDLLLTQGQTDENGIERLSFSTLNLDAGDVVRFTAWDNNGAIDGVELFTISNPFPAPPPIVPECLKVLIDGQELNEVNSIVTLDVNQTKQFSIRSDCNFLRRVNVTSNINMVTGILYDINPGETENLIVKAEAKNGVLGVYPIALVSSNETGVNTIGKLDIIVKDPNSCFDLAQAIFDLKNTGTISSTVTNECYEGRYNNFYPKMDVDTSSVSLQFNKPGNPDFIDFNTMVIGSAMEGLVEGGIGVNVFHTSSKGRRQRSPRDIVLHQTSKITAVSDAKYVDYFQAFCTQWYYDGWTNPKPEPDNNSYWGQFSDPSKPTYRFPEFESYDQTELVLTPKFNDTYTGISSATLQGIGTTRIDSTEITAEAPANASLLPYGELKNGSATIPEYYNVATVDGQMEYGEGYCDSGAELADGLDADARYNVPFKIPRYTYSYFWGPGGADCDTPYWTPGGSMTFAPGAGEPYDTAVWDAEGGMRVVNDGSGRSANTIFSGRDFHSQEKWYSDAPYGIGVGDGGEKWYSVTQATDCSGNGAECKILELGKFQGNKDYIRVRTEGKDESTWTDLFNSPTRTQMKVQIEGIRRLDPLKERRSFWEQEVHLPTTEGAVQKIGSYSGVPVPEWTDIDNWDGGLEVGEGQTDATSNGYFIAACVNSNGLVPPEWPNLGSYKGCVITPNGDTDCEQNAEWGHVGITEFFPHYVVRPPEDPLVEYDYTGTIVYYIPQDTIPGWVEGEPEVRMFLSGGSVYAEYVGVPEIESDIIDFNITKNSLEGEEYATLTVSDWVSDTELGTQEFNIKLTGNNHSCYASDGTEGFEGATYVPKLLFDWDWNAISQEQCDSTNWNYTYCDATQFTVSLGKKLNEIESLVKLGDTVSLPGKTTFYSYLLRDYYSNDFLVDFEEYYSSTLLSAGTSFTLLQSFINDDKLSFVQRASDGSTIAGNPLPFGGLYRVEIDIDMVNENLFTLFDGTTLNANIIVKMELISKAPNYNPFYELPFNGIISNNGSRSGYGVSVTGDNLLLNNASETTQYSGALKVITGLKNEDLVELDKGIVFAYDSLTDSAYYLPSQPTPVQMSVTNSGGSSVEAGYKLEGTGATSPLQKNWRMTSSTIGNSTCYDFDNQDKQSFIDSRTSTGINRIRWNGTKKGTIELTSVFLTPKNSSDTSRVTPINVNTILLSYASLQNSDTVMLNNYDARGIADYDSIKGLFARIASGDMCLSKDSLNTMKIWWNPEYLNGLIDEISSSSGSSC